MTRQAQRLAFWGRVSTEDNQDPESRWAAGSSPRPHADRAAWWPDRRGFFDVDKVRAIPPQRRPQAAALLAALADPNRACTCSSRNMGSPRGSRR
jgi:site-specific DNA recombinase